MLDVEERRRATRFIHPDDSLSFIVTHGAVRWILSTYLGSSPGDIEYEISPFGKPAIRHPERADLRFNISHSSEVVVCAVTIGNDVGVDVEEIRPGRNVLGLAARYFSPTEANELKTLPAQRREEAFYNCWVRKEAYVKARGEGLGRSLDSFELSFDPAVGPALLRSTGAEDDASRWRFFACSPVPGYAGALAVECSVKYLGLFNLNLT